ncbi:carbohydrate ABC transporter permease [Caproiciproducens sp. LBM24188]|nr:carbohydrate ABC transporter permease [Oscillospiraceae bacterium]HHV32866.1 carbohydrate ABC transporter permease [Clostridiales bacterium]
MEQTIRKKRHYTSGDIIFNIINYTVFTLITLSCIYPFYYMFINTISSNQMSANGQINWYPQQIHWKNYIDVFQLSGLPQAFLISVLRTVIGTVTNVLASAFLGFMFTQKKMWKRTFWYRFVVITMYFNAGLVPLFLVAYNLHLTNNFWIYILPMVVQPFNIILVKTYVESIPASLQEAAEIDGAGIVCIFTKIILPVCSPILATIAIFSAVNQWNSFQDTLIYITDSRLYSLQYLLYTYINASTSIATLIKNNPNLSGAAIANLATQQTPTSVRMTVSIIVIIPILLVYPWFQRYFVKGIMIGSVKG